MAKNNLIRKIVSTSDGSHTLFVPELNEHYHSIHGAIQESIHVFIKNGLYNFTEKTNISILEIGFGTGLNALLTFNEAINNNLNVNYTSIEKYPVSNYEISQLNYANKIGFFNNSVFQLLHATKWGSFEAVSAEFMLRKVETDLLSYIADQPYNLVYFDAFAPDIQPKLWTVEVFNKMFKALSQNGILVTYAAKGQVRRNMQAAGFKVYRIAGPPGKREMLKAVKE